MPILGFSGLLRGALTTFCWLLMWTGQVPAIGKADDCYSKPSSGNQAPSSWDTKSQLEAARTAAWLVSRLGDQAFLGSQKWTRSPCLLPACLFLLLGDFLPFSNPGSEAGVQFPGRSLYVPATPWTHLSSPHPSLTTLTLVSECSPTMCKALGSIPST